MTLPVFDGRDLLLPLNKLQVGQVSLLGGKEGHHAAKVKRLGTGECFDLVDACGLRLTCQVVSASEAQGSCPDALGLSGGDQGTQGRNAASGTVKSAPGADSNLSGIWFRVLEKDCLPEIFPRLGLVQALAKAGRDEQSVEAAVELGVDQVIPWMAQRCIVQWKGKKQVAGLKKWQNLLTQAAKQSRRSTWPRLLSACDSPQLAQLIAAEENRSLFLILEADCENDLVSVLKKYRSWLKGLPLADETTCTAGESPLDLPLGEKEACNTAPGQTSSGINPVVPGWGKDPLKSLNSQPPTSLEDKSAVRKGDWQDGESNQLENIYVIVGPEGGITPEELDLFSRAGAIPVRLGQTILRSSSAAPAALAVIAANTGIWQRAWKGNK